MDGLRRELLISSIVEEKNVGGHFLSEKTAGVFYFPHTSFTEFLVADYIMGAHVSERASHPRRNICRLQSNEGGSDCDEYVLYGRSA